MVKLSPPSYPSPLVMFMAVAVFTLTFALTSIGVAHADSDDIECDCTWLQKVSAFVDTGGTGLVSIWTILDDNSVHGYRAHNCPWIDCMFYYSSGDPPFQRQIDELWATGPPVVFINWWNCSFL